MALCPDPSTRALPTCGGPSAPEHTHARDTRTHKPRAQRAASHWLVGAALQGARVEWALTFHTAGSPASRPGPCCPVPAPSPGPWELYFWPGFSPPAASSDPGQMDTQIAPDGGLWERQGLQSKEEKGKAVALVYPLTHPVLASHPGLSPSPGCRPKAKPRTTAGEIRRRLPLALLPSGEGGRGGSLAGIGPWPCPPHRLTRTCCEPPQKSSLLASSTPGTAAPGSWGQAWSEAAPGAR